VLKTLVLISCLFWNSMLSYCQNQPDSLSSQQTQAAADDPSQFFTRTELFTELQHHKNYGNNFYFNQTTWRTIVKIGNRFTTRLDVPFVYNSISAPAEYKQFGLSDISFRLLGYKFLQSKKSAVTASLEISLNTAQSPLLGSGKNILFPVVSYTAAFMENRMLLAFVFQEAISFSGDEARDPVSFSKLQGILLYSWSRRVWTVFAPELYVDYVRGGAAMNLEGRVAYAPTKRINLWAHTGVGLFGDFAPRYHWTVETGCRYFFLRNTMIKRKDNDSQK
jgi:hypothetical protein